MNTRVHLRNEQNSTKRLEGGVIVPSNPALLVILSIALIVVLSLLTLAFTRSYARVEFATGWIVPQKGLIRVLSHDGGLIESVQARDGEHASVGKIIATIRLSAQGLTGDAGKRLSNEIAAEAKASGAAVQASAESLRRKRIGLQERETILRGQLREARNRASLTILKEELAQQQLGRAEQLTDKGFLSVQQLDQMKAARLTATQETSEARAAVLDLERQLGEVHESLMQSPLDERIERAQADRDRAALLQRETVQETANVISVVAPITGQVLAVPVDEGESVTQATTIAVMTPDGSPLIAEIFVPAKAAGFISVGQTVRLKYSTFPFQTYGVGSGTVSEVSHTVLAPQEIKAIGVSTKDPALRVRVRLHRDYVAAYGKRLQLQPGMLLTADIITAQRSLAQMILDPLFAAGK